MTLTEFYEQAKEGIDKVIERYGCVATTHLLNALSTLEQRTISMNTQDENGNISFLVNTDNAQAFLELCEQSRAISKEGEAYSKAAGELLESIDKAKKE